ncbi:MAG TPA: hypothetical protein VIQ31_32080 [Phormidium sp.]
MNNDDTINNIQHEEDSLTNSNQSNDSITNNLDNDDLSIESENNNDNSHHVCSTNNMYHEVKLLKLLNNLGAPLYAYNSIIKWASDAQAEKFNFDTQYKNYHQVINHLEDVLQMESFRPNTITVQLKGDNKEMDVVVFDVATLLSSLFSDTELNKYENLVVDVHDRFSMYKAKDERLGEVNSGQWYRTAYHNLVSDPENDFLCPIILASDKTSLSEMGDLHVDAIFMTTSIFNTQVRQDNKCSKIVHDY